MCASNNAYSRWKCGRVEVIKSGNNASFDRLAEVAVRKVAPFPVQKNEFSTK